MIRAEIIRYCKETLLEIEDNIPKHYVKDVLTLAQESDIELDCQVHIIYKVRKGIIYDKRIVDLLKKLAYRNREASINGINCNI